MFISSESGCLIDGQHRLTAAKRAGLKYIDVIIENVDNSNKSAEQCLNRTTRTSRKQKRLGGLL
ncbi:ParB N-terminal domain-containing protein [Hymenobacter sp. CRA2]|uniref:ParB N-terminal domain-containing protein n=1 Tax=Hymenobacter sp. CRA2 TaxID=1955620 RepID=UPI00099031F2|nr:hypothetical protein B0919_08560 [Hymenobacter sp. CRA2]